MKILQWNDINCTARVKIEENLMEFEVFDIAGHFEDKATGKYTKPIYERKDALKSEDETENLDEAQTLFRGTIKWDACSHVYFGNEDGYIHLCGGRNWVNFMEATHRIWEIAKKELL